MWRCTVCNWIYDRSDEDVPFEDLPASYTCPVCGAPKAAFEPVSGVPADRRESNASVADVLVEHLADLGVNRIYGIPGHSNLPLIEAIRSSQSVHLITTRHEHAAAFMASGHAKLTGQLGVCVSIAGPGATNLMTGLADAAADRAPVLALVGQVPGIFLGSEAFQEINQLDMFKSLATFAETLSRPSQMPRLFGLAVKSAFSRPGVSVLSLPTDVLSDVAVDERWDRPGRLFQDGTVPAKDVLETAADAINEADSPAILAGWGTRRSPELVQTLAETLKAPIATTSRAKGIIPEEHPLSLGVLGSIWNAHAPGVLTMSDLLIVLGSGFRQSNLLPEARVLQLDRDPVRLGRNFTVELGLQGDIPLTLTRMLPLLQSRTAMSEELEDAVTAAKEKIRDQIDSDMSQDGEPVHPGFLVGLLRRHVKPDAVVAVDVGDHTYWFYKRFQCRRQFILMSASMASMGFALPAALAAQFQEPQRQVVCVTGDGGFGMVMAEFTTAVKHHLPIKVVVLNDGCLKNIKKEQARDGYPEYGIDLHNPDFAAFAESTGALGLRVVSGKKLESAIREAFSYDGPALLDVLVDPESMLPGVKRVKRL